MNAIPHIIVQLIHIEGPLKGEIQEFSDPEIVIGRHPDCQVQFPRETVTLSRRHARIIREGNRFKVVDQSTNGTFVNGRQVPEAYLKDGDVITFSEGGPKISFLTQVSDKPAPVQTAPAAPQPPKTAPMAPPPAASQPAPPPIQQPAMPAAPIPTKPIAPAPAAAAPAIQTVKVPFAIQYGPALKSFQTLPITLGKGAGCDFSMQHPGLSDQHAQIFFAEDQYWIKDLTGTNSVTINAMPIAGQAALQADMQIALSPQGPRFRFLGGGRLAEVEEPVSVAPEPPSQPDPSPPKAPDPTDAGGSKPGSLFKKFFS